MILMVWLLLDRGGDIQSLKTVTVTLQSALILLLLQFLESQRKVVAESAGSGALPLWFRSLPLPPLGPWTSYLTSLCLRLPVQW